MAGTAMRTSTRTIIAVSIIILISAVLYGAYRWREWKLRKRCFLTMRRRVWERVFTRDGEVLRLRERVDDLPECPDCGQPYVFHRVEKPLRLSNDRRKLRPVLWCPAPCHRGWRLVMFENGIIYAVPEKAFEHIVAENALGSRIRDAEVP